MLAAFAVAHFAHHVTNSIFGALLPFIRTAFGLSYLESGFAASAFTIASGVTNAPLGVMADRVGARRVIVWGLVLIAASSVAIGLSQTYWQLLLFLLVMGIASGTYHAPASALIAQAFGRERRGVAMGTHTTAGHLSFFVVPLLAGALATETSWRTPYLVLAIAPLLCALMLWRVAPEGSRATDPHSWLATFADIGGVARAVGPLVALSSLGQVLLSAAFTYLTLYLVDARGFSPLIAAGLYGLPQAAGLVGAPLGGSLSDRFGRPRVLLAGLVLMGPAAWALTVAPDWWIVLPLFLLGIGQAIRMTTTEVLVVDNAPPSKRSTILGTYYLVNQPVGGIAAPVFGAIAQVSGLAVTFTGLAAAFVALSLVALVLSMGVTRTRAASSPG
jgi:MFS family permease